MDVVFVQQSENWNTLQTPKVLKKTVWAEALLGGIEIDRENKRAGPCWTFKILPAQSKLIKLFSCKHIQTMYYRCWIADFERGWSSYSECLSCKGLRKWSVIFFHWQNTLGPSHLTLDCVLFAKTFFLNFSDMFKSVSIFQEVQFHGFPCTSRREYAWRNNQVDCCDW